MRASLPGREGPLQEGMATHSSILAWRIPWTEEPGGCSPWGCKESDTTEATSDACRGYCCISQFSRSVASDSFRPHGLQHARPPCQSPTPSRSSLKLMSIESVMPSNHLILCHLLLLPPSIFSSIRIFSSESVLRIRWPKYWSFSFSLSPSNEYSGLISFRMDLLDLLAVQWTLKSLLQHHSPKASILRCSAFCVPTLTSIHDHWKNHSFD